ncbi:Serine/threonine-protein phosphatase 7 long form-like protein [Quillaja saponaria]|uniref:Serine/threonine-protein phosphatase 7 long form-like protein n=1 Tax=Quillaja saponaria TaxID=32244 RepID=A0AAD7LNS0_QUISA|nr:Serine/threonine-protein phosphatase 7 long form-like protein [Quillaja saponaria]
MYEQPKSIIEVREEVMVSPMGESLPCLRKAQFLKPTVTCNGGKTFEIPSSTLSSLPPTFEPTKWPLTTHFKGWRFPPKKWRSWVDSMHFVHESVWKKAGIFEAILNSKYELWRSDDLIFGIAERWSTETKTFIFPWAEATITLEDIMVLGGYSILGDSVHSPIPKEELKETEEKLIQGPKRSWEAV